MLPNLGRWMSPRNRLDLAGSAGRHCTRTAEHTLDESAGISLGVVAGDGFAGCPGRGRGAGIADRARHAPGGTESLFRDLPGIGDPGHFRPYCEPCQTTCKRSSASLPRPLRVFGALTRGPKRRLLFPMLWPLLVYPVRGGTACVREANGGIKSSNAKGVCRV